MDGQNYTKPTAVVIIPVEEYVQLQQKAKDRKEHKHCRAIRGDETRLRRIMLMYEDFRPEFMKEEGRDRYGRTNWSGKYLLVFNVTVSTWKEIVRDLGLIQDKTVRLNRMWDLP